MSRNTNNAPERAQSNDFLDSRGNKIDAVAVSRFFDQSVTKIRDNNNKIATRAANGFFYLEGKSGQQAFYLAPGETAQTIERGNTQIQKYQETRERGRTGVITETRGQIRNVENEIINYEGTRAYYANPKYQSKETVQDIESRLNAALGINLAGNSPRQISDSFIQAVARYQASKGLMIDGQAGQRTYGLLKGERTISARELLGQKDLTASESMNKILSNEEYRQYLVLSGQLSAAIAKDASGPLIEGGLIGIFRRNTELNKMLSSKNPEERARIENELNALGNSFPIKEPNFIAKMFGARGNGYMKDLYGNKLSARKQKTAIIETLSVAALSLLMSGGQSVTVLFGKIKTPFTIQKLNNPGNNVAAYAISGRDSYSLESENDKDQNRLDYDLASASLKERQALVGNQAMVDRAQLEYDHALGGKRLDWKNPVHREAYLRLQREKMNNDPKNGEMFKTFVNMASGVRNIDEFASAYSLPQDPSVRQALNTFYEGGKDAYGKRRSPGDVGLLYEMISDPSKYIGTASMVRVNMGQQDRLTHANKYVNPNGNRPTRGPKEKSDSFGPPLRNLNTSTVTERFQNDNQLMSAYIAQINKLAGAEVSQETILRAISQGQVQNISGFNTGLRTTQTSAKPWSGEAFVIAVPVYSNKMGRPGVHMIGIRKECANYIPGSFVPQEFIQTIPTMDIPLRLSLLWNFNLNRGGGGGRKPEKPEKPDKPDTPEKPEVPGKPDTPEVPEVPGKPIPDKGISSTPTSQNGTVPQGPPQNIIPVEGEGGSTGGFIPSPDAPPASPGAVGVGDIKPVPTNIPFDPFA